MAAEWDRLVVDGRRERYFPEPATLSILILYSSSCPPNQYFPELLLLLMTVSFKFNDNIEIELQQEARRRRSKPTTSIDRRRSAGPLIASVTRAVASASSLELDRHARPLRLSCFHLAAPFACWTRLIVDQPRTFSHTSSPQSIHNRPDIRIPAIESPLRTPRFVSPQKPAGRSPARDAGLRRRRPPADALTGAVAVEDIKPPPSFARRNHRHSHDKIDTTLHIGFLNCPGLFSDPRSRRTRKGPLARRSRDAVGVLDDSETFNG